MKYPVAGWVLDALRANIEPILGHILVTPIDWHALVSAAEPNRYKHLHTILDIKRYDMY